MWTYLQLFLFVKGGWPLKWKMRFYTSQISREQDKFVEIIDQNGGNWAKKGVKNHKITNIEVNHAIEVLKPHQWVVWVDICLI